MHLCWCQLIQIISLISISPWHWHSQTTPVSPSEAAQRASSDKLALTFSGSTLIELHRLGKHGEPRNANGIKQITLTPGCWTTASVLPLTSSGKPIPQWYPLPGHFNKLQNQTYHWDTFLHNMSEMYQHLFLVMHSKCYYLWLGSSQKVVFLKRWAEEQVKMQFGRWDLSW